MDCILKPTDMIFYQEGNKTKSLGFEIHNEFLNKMPAIIQKNNKDNTMLAVPAGLFLLHQTLDDLENTNNKVSINKENKLESGEHEDIDGELYKRLLELVKPGKNKKTDRIKYSKKSKKTNITRKSKTKTKKTTTRKRK
tara:strand:+ start:33 stop:449 length:417 start_codon:yes stop_codon:yes gene_type:complete